MRESNTEPYPPVAVGIPTRWFQHYWESMGTRVALYYDAIYTVRVYVWQSRVENKHYSKIEFKAENIGTGLCLHVSQVLVP